MKHITIMRRPRDYPLHFIAIEWILDDRGMSHRIGVIMIAHTIGALSEALEKGHLDGMFYMTRSPDDEPQIVGTYI